MDEIKQAVLEDSKGRIKRFKKQVKDRLDVENIPKICDKCECGAFELFKGIEGKYCRRCYCLFKEVEAKFIGGTLRK